MTDDTMWRNWLEINGSRLMLYARQLSRCEADAEDVLQNALLKTWRSSPETANPEDLRGLIFTNIRRCAIDLGRHTERRTKRDTDFQLTAISRGEHLAWFELPDDDESRELQVALTAVPEKFREVITLKIWGGLTFAQIGGTLDIPANTAASRYRYGLDNLRARLAHCPPT